MDYYAGTWPGVGAVLATFVPAGIHHIAIGPDHILFLVGLLLLGGSLRRLALDRHRVHARPQHHAVARRARRRHPPARLVEPAIALSIVLVGADNLLRAEERAAPRPARLAGRAFGLVHGFGFAAVLREFGLPQARSAGRCSASTSASSSASCLVVPLVASALAALRVRSDRPADSIAHGRLCRRDRWPGRFWFVQRVFFPGGIA